MQLHATKISNLLVVIQKKAKDSRGSFERVYCYEEFKEAGLNIQYVQTSISKNYNAFTLRGMHYQLHPYQEIKIVTCISGEIFDVVIDLRKDSPTYLKWHGEVLNSKNQKSMYVPNGCAHGFMTLKRGSNVLYNISEPYSATLARGIHWADPKINIQWPSNPRVISDRDNNFSFLNPSLCA